MSFLDQPVSDMTLDDLVRLIGQQIARQVPSIPARLLELGDKDNPILDPGANDADNALIYDALTGRWDGKKITAASIEAVWVLASALVAGALGGSRVELGYGTDSAGNLDTTFIGIRAYEEDGATQTFFVDAETGQVRVSGTFDFGEGSHLTNDDLIDLRVQADGYAARAKVQGGNSLFSSTATPHANWPNETISGNLLVAIVYARGSSAAPGLTATGTWVLAKSVTVNNARLSMFKKSEAPAESGSSDICTVSGGGTVQWGAHLSEWSGANDVDTTASFSASGAGTTIDSGALTGAAMAQDENLIIAAFGGTEETDAVQAQRFGSVDSGYTNYTDSILDITSPSPDWEMGFAGSYKSISTKADQDVTRDTTQASFPDWNPSDRLGVIVTFKAKLNGGTPENPGSDIVRWFSKDVASVATPYVKLENGQEFNLLQPTGTIIMSALRNAPDGWLNCNGGAVSRTTYSYLYAAIMPVLGTVSAVDTGTETITCSASHGLVAQDAVMFQGTPPTGLSAETVYYVIAAGLTATAFRVALARNGAAINLTVGTTGATIRACPYGLGNGTTTFNVPNFDGKAPRGAKQTDVASASVLGFLGGEETHAIIANELPAHSHPNTASFAGTAGGLVHPHNVQLTTGANLAAFASRTAAAGAVTLIRASGAETPVEAQAASAGTPAGTVTMTNANNSTTGLSMNVLAPYNTVYFLIRT
jgi:microcystin-dependent protein